MRFRDGEKKARRRRTRLLQKCPALVRSLIPQHLRKGMPPLPTFECCHRAETFCLSSRFNFNLTIELIFPRGKPRGYFAERSPSL